MQSSCAALWSLHGAALAGAVPCLVVLCSVAAHSCVILLPNEYAGSQWHIANVALIACAVMPLRDS